MCLPLEQQEQTNKNHPKNVVFNKKKVMRTGQSSVLPVLTLNQEHDYSMQAGKFDQIFKVKTLM